MPSITEINTNKKLFYKYSEKQKYYSCNNINNYLNYINRGTKEIDYVSYSGDSKKSVGLFNRNGLINKEHIKELQENLRNTNSPIWHGLISFEEVFGKEYCGTYEQAYELMKTEFNKFLKNANFNANNIKWFAGLHNNTD